MSEPSIGAQSVALVGFMGAGKSAVGRLAARLLDVPFVDCDARIERLHGPIDDLFATLGEAGFRRLERDVVVPLLEEARLRACVLALGGGAVLSGDVREALRRLSHVAWLTAPPEVLWRRVGRGAATVRPLARDEVAFRRLLAEREALYREVATATVLNDGGAGLDEVAAVVAALASDVAGRDD